MSFNLLSEILFVQALTVSSVAEKYKKFQSLERDSVCSSHHRWPSGDRPKPVSIS